MRRLLVLLLIGLVLIAVPAFAQEAPETVDTPKPAVTVEPALGAVGDAILVEGTGWPAGSFVNVALCGNLALRGSGDCALDSAVGAAVGPEGQFGITTVAAAPPVACPCVVHVTSLASPAKVDIPYQLADHPVEPIVRPDNRKPPSYEVSVPDVAGKGPFLSWFGGAPERDVRIVVTNTGPSPIIDGSVIVAVDRAANPTRPAWQGTIDLVAPGESFELIAPVVFPAPAFGEYFVSVRVDAAPTSVTARTTETVWPWGLLALVVLLIQWPILKLRNRVRRRLERSLEDDAAVTDEVSSDVDPEEELVEPVAAPVGAPAAGGFGEPAATPVVPIALRRNGARGIPVIIETPISDPQTPEARVTIVVDPSLDGEAPRILGVSIQGDAKTQVEIVESTGGIETPLDDVIPAEVEPNQSDHWSVEGIDDRPREVRLEGEGDDDAFRGFFAKHSDEAAGG